MAAPAVAALKQRPGGNIAVLGSGELVRTLLANHLVDELLVVVCPIVLGSGKRLFGHTADQLELRVVTCEPTSTGAVILNYRSEGPDETPR